MGTAPPETEIKRDKKKFDRPDAVESSHSSTPDTTHARAHQPSSLPTIATGRRLNCCPPCYPPYFKNAV